jgi:hypothetical protein
MEAFAERAVEKGRMSNRNNILLFAMISALFFAGSPPAVSKDFYSPFLPQSQPKLFPVTSLDRVRDGVGPKQVT